MDAGSLDWWISQLLTLPVLIGSLLIGAGALFLLIRGGRRLGKVGKTLLAVLWIAAWALASGLIALAIAFGSNHPPAPPAA